MITYQELHKQIHQITEISNVFLYLIENRKMCDTQITCDLFFDYVNKVKHHLEVGDKNIYTAILRDGDAVCIFGRYRDRGVRQAGFRVLVGAYMPAALIELDSESQQLTVWNGGLPHLLGWFFGKIARVKRLIEQRRLT